MWIGLLSLALAAAGPELVITVPAETSLGAHGARAARELWPEMIDSARATIELGEFYAATKDQSAISPVVERLRAAGARGVKIRMIVDQKLEGAYNAELAALRAIAGLELRAVSFGEGVHHAKYIIADGRVAYVGSHNFDWRSLEHIHELGVRLETPAIVAAMRAVFEHDWSRRAPVAVETGRGPIELLISPSPDTAAALARLIGGAQKELEIELLEYCPLDYPKKRYYPPIDNALRDAAARGVTVRLLVSNWNTEAPCIDHLKSLDILPNVEVRIATIPEAKSGFIPFARVIHAKYMVADGTILWLGTSNWAGGYFDNSRNFDLIIRDRALAETAHQIHRELWSSRYAEPLDLTRKYPPPRRK